LADGFNHGFDRLSSGYSWIIRHLVSSWIGLTGSLLVFVCLLGATYLHEQQGSRRASSRPWTRATPSSSSSFPTAPRWRVPTPSSSRWATSPARFPASATPCSSPASAARPSPMPPMPASSSCPFKSFAEREEGGENANKIIGQLFGKLQSIQEAFIIAIPPPSVRGVGNSGGFKMQIVDQENPT
jgi:HAE1 family hydrophobic/amphiphilic exporter-1